MGNLCTSLSICYQTKVHVPNASKRPKLKTSEYGVRKEGANQEDGSPSGASSPSCSLDQANGF